MSGNRAEPEYARPASAAEETLPPWYSPDISKYLVPSTVDLLSKYSKLKDDELNAHVHTIRDKAWAIRGYPCTGLGIFMVPWLSKSPAYAEVLEVLKKGGTLLDVGCFIGFDMRQLVFDGAPSDRMVGLDIVSHWEVGLDLFQDRQSFKATFIEGDILKADQTSTLAPFKGNIDVIEFSAVMHQWDWNTQAAALKQLVRLSKRGTLLVGYQIGSKDGRELEGSFRNVPYKQFRQSPATFEDLWKEVSAASDTRWETSAQMRSFTDIGWDANDMDFLQPDDAVLDFVVRRVK